MSRSEQKNRYGIPVNNYSGTALRYNQAVHFFEMGDHKYSANPLDPLEQVHIARRLAPILLGALKPEQGRKAIIARLAGMASLAASQEAGAPKDATSEQVIADALDLATSVFGAAAATDEETVNTIIRKCMHKIWRDREGGGGTPLWDAKNDVPAYGDIDGFKMMSLVVRYLFLEFKDSIIEYIGSLNLKPGPALAAAAAGTGQRPPGAPGTE